MTQAPGIEGFFNKAEKYAEGRPGYPAEALNFLMEQLNLNSSMRVADVGAGTGLLTRDLRRRFKEVVAVEPNDEMRAELDGNATNGTAENTGLKSESVDAIFSAQAFHWFEPVAAREEFFRVLKDPKPVALIWNNRLVSSDPGARRLDEIMSALQIGASSALKAHEGTIVQFFKTEKLNKTSFDNFTFLTKKELRSMVLSRSYAPREGDAGYPELVRELDKIFDAHSQNERFSVPYKTIVYWGQLSH